MEGILTDAVTEWFGNMSAQDRKQSDRVVRTAPVMIGWELQPLVEISTFLRTPHTRLVTTVSISVLLTKD